MRFAIWPVATQSWDDLYEIAVYCEQTGWDGVYVADHFMPNGPGSEPVDGDMLEWPGVVLADVRNGVEPSLVAQARLYMSTDADWVRDKKRELEPGRPVIVGTPAEVTDIVGRCREAGADELIIPDATLGSGVRRKETCDLLMTEVAPAFCAAS